MMIAYKNKNLSPKERALDLLSRMKVKEKVGQINQRLYGFNIYERQGNDFILSEEFKEEVKKYSGLGVLYGLYRADPWSGKNYANGIDTEYVVRVYNQVQRYVLENSRLGIPMMMSSECPHGHQALDGYLLPVNLAVGATFHPDLLKSAYAVCGKQLSLMGVDFALISTLDILRDPRWGRSEECYSEDPYLASMMARAAVEGCQSQGVAVVAKHFLAQGEGTGGINASAARIGERELREIHLPAAVECVAAGVKGIMAAYNEVDGIPCHASKHLLTDILRKELGYQGVIMADGVAIDCLNVITGDSEQSAALALKAGVDISLWDNGFTLLDKALKDGAITLEELDQAVLRVLELKFERGLFDKPYLEENKELTTFTSGSYSQSLELARHSVVLLENKKDLLPLNRNKIKSIAVIGPNADQLYNQLGDYTGPVRPEQGVTLLQGIIQIANDQVRIEYAKGCDIFTGDEEAIRQAVELSRECDLTILALGGSSSRFKGASFDTNGAAIADGELSMDCGEGVDCSTLELPGGQQRLANEIFKLGKSVITVLIQGRPYAVTEIAKNSDALLCAFYPGMQGGQAIAEILFGRIAPSGRLPVSIPRHVGQLPVYYNYKSSYTAMNYYDVEKKPLYSFGYGMTYGELKYDNIKLSRSKVALENMENIDFKVSFQIKNNGDHDTYAVPQLYIRDLQSSTVRRVRELKAFQKVLVPAGKVIKTQLSLSRKELSIWNADMEFVVEKGDFVLYLCDFGKEYWAAKIKVI